MSVQPRLLNLSIYINEHLTDELTLEFLASRMNLSPFHFHRKFRAYFGESLHQHIKRLRLERSAHELLYRVKPVSQVARVSGYKTLSAFSHAFSAHFGVAPTRFREVMQSGSLGAQDETLRETFGERWLRTLAPARIEKVAERPLVFLRANLDASRDTTEICKTLDQLRSVVGTASEFVIASADLFGIDTGTPIRLEVGRDTAYLDPETRARYGQVVLPGGRYAVFEYHGAAKNIADLVRSIYRFWLPTQGERARSSPHYLTLSGASQGESGDFRIYVPLVEVAGEGGVVPDTEFADDELADIAQS